MCIHISLCTYVGMYKYANFFLINNEINSDRFFFVVCFLSAIILLTFHHMLGKENTCQAKSTK